MFTAHSKYGIGQLTGVTENNYIVFYPEVEKTCNLIKSIPTTFYATYEAAELALEDKEAAKEQAISEAKNIDISASVWLAAKNLENAKNNLPSSLR